MLHGDRHSPTDSRALSLARCGRCEAPPKASTGPLRLILKEIRHSITCVRPHRDRPADLYSGRVPADIHREHPTRIPGGGERHSGLQEDETTIDCDLVDSRAPFAVEPPIGLERGMAQRAR